MEGPSVKKIFHFRLFVITAIFPLPLFFSSDLCARQGLTINTPGEAPYHYADQTGIIDLWLKEVFARIRQEVIVDWQPPERGLMNANIGIIDGDAGRIDGLSRRYPNLLQVPEVFMVADFLAFTKNFSFQQTGWESLRPYHVAIVRGHKLSEANVKGTQSLIRTGNAEALFRLLNSDRTDVAVCERRFGSLTAKRINPQIKGLEPPLASVNFYLYLHKKHEPLVPRVSHAIKAMKGDGTYERLLIQSERKSGMRR